MLLDLRGPLRVDRLESLQVLIQRLASLFGLVLRVIELTDGQICEPISELAKGLGHGIPGLQPIQDGPLEAHSLTATHEAHPQIPERATKECQQQDVRGYQRGSNRLGTSP